MEKIISKDGTPIAVEVKGSGAALLLVHGTNGDHARWSMVIPQLSEHFTVYAMDRRGRGESGDQAEYSIEREAEDIAAVANSIRDPVNVFGHSFGAACVLLAARQINQLKRLILYEPPMLHNQQTPERDTLLSSMDEALAEGNQEKVIITMLQGLLGMPSALIERMRLSPAWTAQFAGAYTIPRELRQSDVYGNDLQAYKAITAPTLFLSGSDSPAFFRATMDILCQSIPNSRMVVLTGQQHSAMLTAPDLLAKEVIRFLNEE